MLFPDAFAAALSDRTTALAAAFIIATRHVDVLQWVAKTLDGAAPEPQPRRKSNGAARGGRRSNGAVRKPAASRGSYFARRRETRDRGDESLLEALRMAAGASIGDLATAIGKSRSSTVSALHRLRDAGLVENHDRCWRLTEPEAPIEPPERWTKPVRGDARSAHAHLTAS